MYVPYNQGMYCMYRVGQINWDKIHFPITDLFMAQIWLKFYIYINKMIIYRVSMISVLITVQKS